MPRSEYLNTPAPQWFNNLRPDKDLGCAVEAALTRWSAGGESMSLTELGSLV